MLSEEKHYRVKELAALWGFSGRHITKMFTAEPGVLRISRGTRVRLSIPASVAERVHARLSYVPPRQKLPVETRRIRDFLPIETIRIRDFLLREKTVERTPPAPPVRNEK